MPTSGTLQMGFSGLLFRRAIVAICGIFTLLWCMAPHADSPYGHSATAAEHKKTALGGRMRNVTVPHEVSLAERVQSSGAAQAEQTTSSQAMVLVQTRLAGEAAGVASEWELVIDRRWQAFELEGQPILNGTSVVVVFRADGSVSGNAGTNNYRGFYERVGRRGLAVSNLATNRAYLDHPPGRMRQENLYLNALQSIERFTLEDDELALWAGSDRRIRYAPVL